MRYSRDDLSDYRRDVRVLMRRNDGTPINNSTEEHAKIIIEQLAMKAKRKIDILSGSLTRDVYGDKEVVKAIDHFLEKSPDNRLRIILEQDNAKDRSSHPLFIRCEDKSNMHLRIAPPDLKKRYTFHTFLVDDDSYRFEIDRDRPVGIGAFGHKKGAQNLSNAFNLLWDQCKDR